MAIETSEHTRSCSARRRTTSGCTSRSWAAYRDREIPIIERGEGPYLFDTHGKRYLDMLSGPVHRADRLLVRRGARPGRAPSRCAQLPFYTNWTYAHPPAIELAAKLAELAPPNINRFFFVSGGSEAVESAWKLARQYHAAAASRCGAR